MQGLSSLSPLSLSVSPGAQPWDDTTHIPGGFSLLRFTSLEIPSLHAWWCSHDCFKHSHTYEGDEQSSWLLSKRFQWGKQTVKAGHTLLNTEPSRAIGRCCHIHDPQGALAGARFSSLPSNWYLVYIDFTAQVKGMSCERSAMTEWVRVSESPGVESQEENRKTLFFLHNEHDPYSHLRRLPRGLNIAPRSRALCWDLPTEISIQIRGKCSSWSALSPCAESCSTFLPRDEERWAFISRATLGRRRLLSALHIQENWRVQRLWRSRGIA